MSLKSTLTQQAQKTLKKTKAQINLLEKRVRAETASSTDMVNKLVRSILDRAEEIRQSAKENFTKAASQTLKQATGKVRKTKAPKAKTRKTTKNVRARS